MISSTTLSTVLTVSSIIYAPPLKVSLIPSPTRLTSVSLSSRQHETSKLEVVVAVTPEDVEPELSSFLEQPASITPQRPRQVSIANIFFIIKFLSV